MRPGFMEKSAASHSPMVHGNKAFRSRLSARLARIAMLTEETTQTVRALYSFND